MVHFHVCDSRRNTFFPEILDLYNDSFPIDERRSKMGLSSLFDKRIAFRCLALSEKSHFLGFIIFWEFQNFAFVEHFAIMPTERGKSYGTQALNKIMKALSKPIVLEVELPETENAKRRIAFYENLNFNLCKNPYAQPAYNPESESVPMYLMCSNEKFLEDNFDFVKKQIYKEVYSI